jgi:hypothetical protein
VRWTLAAGMGRIGVADAELKIATSLEMRWPVLDA